VASAKEKHFSFDGISDVMEAVKSGATTILHPEEAKANNSHKEPKNGTN